MPELDLRGLPPPEPLELAVAAVAKLAPGQSLDIRHHRQPYPLYSLLEREGLPYTVKADGDGFVIHVQKP